MSKVKLFTVGADDIKTIKAAGGKFLAASTSNLTGVVLTPSIFSSKGYGLECKTIKGVVTLGASVLKNCFLNGENVEIPVSFKLTSEIAKDRIHPANYANWKQFKSEYETLDKAAFKVWNDKSDEEKGMLTSDRSDHFIWSYNHSFDLAEQSAKE